MLIIDASLCHIFYRILSVSVLGENCLFDRKFFMGAQRSYKTNTRNLKLMLMRDGKKIEIIQSKTGFLCFDSFDFCQWFLSHSARLSAPYFGLLGSNKNIQKYFLLLAPQF